jgi:hypothetical protein
MSTRGKDGSVALQQKGGMKVKYDKLTNGQLHQEMLDARNKFHQRCAEAHNFAVDAVIPLCEAIIARYKMQGVPAKVRPNGKPTVEAYFKSIDLNYNTVRSWIHRNRLQAEMFQPKERSAGKTNDNKVRHLTELEECLLGSATVGHDLVKAIKQDGNVDEAVKEYLAKTPTIERIEEYIERPADSAAERLRGLGSEKLAKALAAEITRLISDSGNGERVRTGVNGECSISYDEGTNCFVVNVQVPKQEATDDRPASKRQKTAEGGAQ